MMNPLRWLLKPSTPVVEHHTDELPEHKRCQFQFGGTRCHMQRTTHGKFCTFHR